MCCGCGGCSEISISISVADPHVACHQLSMLTPGVLVPGMLMLGILVPGMLTLGILVYQ